MLKRTIQAYLAYGRSAEGLLADAGLGWAGGMMSA